MAKTSTPPLDIVTVEPIKTDVQVTSEHLIALLVSQVEENIIAKERQTKVQLEQANQRRDEFDRKIDDALRSLGKTKIDEFSKLGLLKDLKKLGLQKGEIHVDAEVFTPLKKAKAKKQPTDQLRFTVIVSVPQSGRLQGQLTSPMPKTLVKMIDQRKKVIEQIQQLTTVLLDLKAYRQNEMPSLERWSRGRLAAETLKRSGGKMSDFAQTLENMLPDSLRGLLS